MSMAKRFGSFVLLLVYGLIPLATSSPLELSTLNFNYANITEHCEDLWSFTGRELITSSLLPGSEMSWNLYDFYTSKGNYDTACYNGSISFNIAAAFEDD
jgi:hypothetical protein